MKSITFLVVFFLFFTVSTEASENWVFRARSGSQIDDLILNPAPEIQQDEKTGRSLYVLKGIYFRESWDLLISGKRIQTDTAGVFYLRLPISGEVSAFELTALGPQKKKQVEKIEIVIPKDEGMQILQTPPSEKDEQAVAAPPAPVKQETLPTPPLPEKKEIPEETAQAPEPVLVPVPAPVIKESKYIKIIPHESSAKNNSTSASMILGEKGFQFKRLLVAPLFATQNGASQRNFSALIGWSPGFKFTESLSLRGTLGGMVFEKATGGRFLATVAELLGEWNLHPRWSIAAGPGFQNWWSFGGFNPLASGELSFYTELTLLDSFRLERISAGGSWLFDNAQTKQARLGFVFAF